MSPRSEAREIPTVVIGPVRSWDQSNRVDLADVTDQSNELHAPGSPLESNGFASLKTDFVDNGDEAQLRSCRSLDSGEQPKSELEKPFVGDILQGMDRYPEAAAVSDGGTDRDILDLSDEHEDIGQALADRLRAAFVTPSQEGSQDGTQDSFMPFDALENLITRDIIRKVLKAENRIPDLTEAKLSRIVDETWSISPTSSQNAEVYPTHPRDRSLETMSSRRKLFAILAYLHRVSEIVGFIQEQIFDNDLPFELRKIGKRNIVTRQFEGAPREIKLFSRGGRDGWKDCDKDLFISHQWKMQAPYFYMQGTKCHNLKLPVKVILPFLEKRNVRAEGGFGEICKVKIHPQHHDHEFTHDEHEYFAIKRLKYSEDAEILFKKEMANLKRVRNHPNIIRLMATYEWKGDYHFLFPCATGDLRDFWIEYWEGPYLERNDRSTPEWLAGQCLALTQALAVIHLPERREENSLSPERDRGKYGRHGDLKPENILWFKSKHEGFGHFKIADFGLSEFHGTASLRDDPKKTGRTRTFRAPETETKNDMTPDYDIWTLGCVFLLHIGWYIHGAKHLEDFATNRIKDSKGAATRFGSDFLEEDNFFTFGTCVEGGRNVERATMKKSVIKELDDLKQHPNSSDLIIDLLDIIQKDLLRMRPKERLSIEKLVKKFESLYRRCCDDPDYGLKWTKKPDRTCTGLSSLAAPSSVLLPGRIPSPKLASRRSISPQARELPSIDSALPTRELGRRSSELSHPATSQVPALPQEDSSGLTAVENPEMAEMNHQQHDSAASVISCQPKALNRDSFLSRVARANDETDNVITAAPSQEADMSANLLSDCDRTGYGTVRQKNANEDRSMTDSSDDGSGCACGSLSWLQFMKKASSR